MHRFPRILFLTAVLFALACGGPLVMIPGGELSGTVQPAPPDWAFSDGVDDVQLETRPSDPYSVNVWGVGAGDRFLIAAGGGVVSAWATNMIDDSRVRLRIGENIYEMEAMLTDDEGVRTEFLAAAKEKYDFEPDAEQSAEAALFVLTPR